MIKKELVIIGGGPAGMAAAIEAAKAGVKVLIIESNGKVGGQLVKQIHKFFGSSAHSAGIRGIDIGESLYEEAKQLGVEIWLNSAVIGLFEGRTVAVEVGTDDQDKEVIGVSAEKIIIATGASENAVYFHGWTLPGVMGAGAAQTMINLHRVIPGKRVLMIGSGNVGLIVAYQLMQAGCEVVALVEAAGKIGGYGVHASKISRAGVPIYTRHTVIEAKGTDNVQEAIIAEIDDKWQPIPGTEKSFDVDTITIAAGLKPLTELARMYGCEMKFDPILGGWAPLHDENMESTCKGVYIVGDISGVEEANTALEEGRLAGTAAAEALGKLDRENAKKAKEEIWSRLKGLRLGPHGEARMKAKERQMGSFHEYRDNTEKGGMQDVFGK